MKKLMSLILTLAMVFSLAIPAMAAEPTVTGNKEGTVSGTYDPVIKITDVTLSEYQNNGALVIDEENKQYIVTIPAGQTFTNVQVNFAGQNLDMIEKEDTNYAISIFNAEYPTTIGWQGTSFGYTVSDNYVGTHEVKFTNDGWKTEEYTGWKLVVKQNYTITNATTDTNGTVTVPAEAAADDTVTVGVTPNEGYELMTLKVVYTDTEGAEQSFFADENNQFVMPASNVTVKATFTEAVETYTVTVEDSENGTVTVDPNEYTAGETVTLTVTPAQGYALASLTVNGEDVTANEVDCKYTFAMPAADVTVTAVFEKIKAEITGVAIIIDGVEYNKDKATSEADPAVITPDYSTVTLKVYGTNLNYGSENNRILYKVGDDWVDDSNDWTINDTGTEATCAYSAGGLESITESYQLQYSNTGTNNWIDGGVWIIYKVPTYTVTGYEDANGNQVTADVAEAKEGDTVTLTVTTVGKYQLKSIAVKDAAGNTVEFTETGLTTYKFEMPASAVTVEATFEEVLTTSAAITWGSMSFTYTDGENGAEGAWSADVDDQGNPGNFVTVTNTGDTTFKATAEYKQEADYTEINGYFDIETEPYSTSKTVKIEAGETGNSYTFTLTLSGKPKKALGGENGGTKIGTVTITIDENVFIPV